MRNYDDRWKRYIKKAFNNIEYFKKATDHFLEDLVYALKMEYYETNSYIFKPG